MLLFYKLKIQTIQTVVAAKKSAVFFIFVLLCGMYFAPSGCFKIFLFISDFNNLILIWLDVVFFMFFVFGVHWVSWIYGFIVFIIFDIYSVLFLQIFFCLFPPLFRDSNNMYIWALEVVPQLSFFLFQSFFLFLSFWIVLLLCFQIYQSFIFLYYLICYYTQYFFFFIERIQLLLNLT